jgi:hypothetical protein
MGSKLNVAVKFCRVSNGRSPQFKRAFQTGIPVEIRLKNKEISVKKKEGVT